MRRAEGRHDRPIRVYAVGFARAGGLEAGSLAHLLPPAGLMRNGAALHPASSGEELIEAINEVDPKLKKIVFSIEDKSFRIKSLFNDLGINAYISKGRNSIIELRKAIERTFQNEEKILSSDLSFSFSDKALIEIESYDISILKLLAQGYILENISNEFKSASITPNGTSSIEKRINKLKIYFKANNNVHLIAIAKDFGLV